MQKMKIQYALQPQNQTLESLDLNIKVPKDDEKSENDITSP